jgi:hypothetical protein
MLVSLIANMTDSFVCLARVEKTEHTVTGGFQQMLKGVRVGYMYVHVHVVCVHACTCTCVLIGMVATFVA